MWVRVLCLEPLPARSAAHMKQHQPEMQQRSFPDVPALAFSKQLVIFMLHQSYSRNWVPIQFRKLFTFSFLAVTQRVSWNARFRQIGSSRPKPLEGSSQFRSELFFASSTSTAREPRGAGTIKQALAQAAAVAQGEQVDWFFLLVQLRLGSCQLFGLESYFVFELLTSLLLLCIFCLQVLHSGLQSQQFASERLMW
jgi:hypothetical protein